MSVFRSRPALRWLVPSAAALVVIGGGAAAGTIMANAGSGLPERSAAELLVDLQNADPDGFSGTVVQSSDLGLPGIAGLAGKAAGSGSLASLIGGTNSARVWYAGEDKARVALLSSDGQTDVIRNGADVWMWSSKDNAGTHLKLPANVEGKRPAALPSGVPGTPQEAADAALAAIDPTTRVETTGASKVAGRDAYELVLSPRDTASLIGQVRLAIDAEHHIPLRVDVYAKNATKPAVRVAFEQVSFAVPDVQQFSFSQPPGAEISEITPGAVEKELTDEKKIEQHRPAGVAEPKVIGKGWTSVIEAKLPKPDAKKADGTKVDGTKVDPQAMLAQVAEKVRGSWGSGYLVRGSLFSVLITDDGRVLAGAVAPEKLYELA